MHGVRPGPLYGASNLRRPRESNASTISDAEALPSAIAPPPSVELFCFEHRPPRRPQTPFHEDWIVSVHSTPKEDWPAVEDGLEEAREMRRRTACMQQDAFARLTAFLERHGQEGERLAGQYPRMMRDEEDGNAVKREHRAEVHRQRLAREDEQRAAAELQAFREPSHREATVLQRRLLIARAE